MRPPDRQPSAGELTLWRRVTRGLIPRESAPSTPKPERKAAPAAAEPRKRSQTSALPASAVAELPPPAEPALDRRSSAAWHAALRGVIPLPGRAAPPAPDSAPAPDPADEAPSIIAPPPKPSAPTRAAPAARPSVRLDRSRPVDLDRRTWLKLRRGLVPIDARLDLHGLTQDQAHQALDTFLANARTRGHRCVLVITGRGLRHGGTLRAATPRWLDTAPLRPRVLAYADAQLRHGGEGALYVLLRRAG